MEQANERLRDAADAICDAFNQIGDFSYAIMPRELAHAVGDLKKAVLSSLRGAIDCEIGWIDARVAGGDKIRSEWQEKCGSRETPNEPAEQL